MGLELNISGVLVIYLDFVFKKMKNILYIYSTQKLKNIFEFIFLFLTSYIKHFIFYINFYVQYHKKTIMTTFIGSKAHNYKSSDWNN